MARPGKAGAVYSGLPIVQAVGFPVATPEGLARLGEAWQGQVRRGSARQGKARAGNSGLAISKSRLSSVAALFYQLFV